MEWTTSEERFLRENHNRYQAQDIAKIMGRTKWSIYHKRTQLGLKGRVKPIYAMYRGDKYLYSGTVEELAKFHGVKVGTIKHYKSPLGRRRFESGRNKILIIRIDEE